MWFLKKQVKNREYVSKNSQLVSLQHTEPIHKTFSLNLTSDLHTNKILCRVLTALVISSLDIPNPSNFRSLLLHKTHPVFPNN